MHDKLLFIYILVHFWQNFFSLPEPYRVTSELDPIMYYERGSFYILLYLL